MPSYSSHLRWAPDWSTESLSLHSGCPLSTVQIASTTSPYEGCTVQTVPAYSPGEGCYVQTVPAYSPGEGCTVQTVPAYSPGEGCTVQTVLQLLRSLATREVQYIAKNHVGIRHGFFVVCTVDIVQEVTDFYLREIITSFVDVCCIPELLVEKKGGRKRWFVKTTVDSYTVQRKG
jgi:hypothetical protein